MRKPDGIGRPNLYVNYDGAIDKWKFVLHMEIEDLEEQEAKDLLVELKRSLSSDDRDTAKDMMKQLMRDRKDKNFKSGHKLINALNKKPSEDDDLE